MDLVKKNNRFFSNWNNSIKIYCSIVSEVHHQFISTLNFWMMKINFDRLDLKFSATRDNFLRVIRSNFVISDTEVYLHDSKIECGY